MFHCLFWSFRSCINGFQYYKPIVQVDGTWLYGTYSGTLLVAVAQDGNNKILLIVFVVVESESTGAWLLFLQNLKRHVTPQHGLCLILDRHESIKSAYSRCDIGWTTQNFVHAFCIRHVAHNYMRYKNNPIKTLIINMHEYQTSFSLY